MTCRHARNGRYVSACRRCGTRMGMRCRTKSNGWKKSKEAISGAIVWHVDHRGWKVTMIRWVPLMWTDKRPHVWCVDEINAISWGIRRQQQIASGYHQPLYEPSFCITFSLYSCFLSPSIQCVFCENVTKLQLHFPRSWFRFGTHAPIGGRWWDRGMEIKFGPNC